ncbi:flagellar export protein FliJ [Chromobacterium sp. IIBBL 290-4]|uniref:flagellar export protein FliJ n=1 Tax=Chromobacterium sp. IIBBL 290-4 TaxID=2953890 RepID=UPI0020B8C3C9|nr:flagellar export protein FliJ [Chromobacterium sp. IIBBL 290-4]UTH73149.1 flagellar export protein FliJ [Chromobacterium sp. IIBBL 290-4]
MNQAIDQLNLLLQLRERDGEKLEAELAAKRRLQERYRRNIERLDELSSASGASGAAPHPALALNCADYKRHLQGLRQSQQQDMQLAAADAEISRQRLQTARCREEQARRLRDEKLAEWRETAARGEQKRSDEAAGQVWLRGRGGW